MTRYELKELIKKLALEQRDAKAKVRRQTSLYARNLLDKRSKVSDPRYYWDYDFYDGDVKCKFINANDKLYHNKTILRFLDIIRRLYKGEELKTLSDFSNREGVMSGQYTMYYYTLAIGNNFLKSNNIVLPDEINEKLHKIMK